MAETTEPLTPSGLDRLGDVQQSVEIVLGTTVVSFNQASEWSEGSLIELDKISGEAVDILVNGKLCFRSEVVTIAENFGVRITEAVVEA
jgi:flagellar motor switch protein FliN/FliY